MERAASQFQLLAENKGHCIYCASLAINKNQFLFSRFSLQDHKNWFSHLMLHNLVVVDALSTKIFTTAEWLGSHFISVKTIPSCTGNSTFVLTCNSRNCRRIGILMSLVAEPSYVMRSKAPSIAKILIFFLVWYNFRFLHIYSGQISGYSD